jgi:triacylglycerol esterase/lipase EstA (alpha/beta hydrolase family)
VAATLGGQTAGATVNIKIRGSARDSISTVIRGLLHVTAESSPCTGKFIWKSSDEEVVSVQEISKGPGTSQVDLRGLRAGTATITVSFAASGSAVVAEDSITVSVYDSGPILFVHGWRGTGSGWEPVMAALESQKNLLRGGSLCADWVRLRGRFVRARNSDGTFRTGNTDQYVCDEAADDGAFFTLNFDDNQNSFVDTAGELSDVVNQIERRLGGDECGIAPNETRTLPDTCPKLTIVAHSMGGQTSRAFIQSIVHSRLTPGDYPVGAEGIPDSGQRIGMPFRPYNGQVRKFVTIGTMNLGTPVPNLTKDETLIFFGLSSLVADLSGLFNQSVDPFSYAILSMQVNSSEWQLMSNYHLDVVRGLDLVSIVTQAPQDFAINVCAALQAGDEGATQIYNGLSLPARAVLAVFAAAAGQTVQGFIPNVMARLNERLCGMGNPDITSPPVLGTQVVGLPFVPASDEIVGVDSQNINNLFRYLDHHPDGIVHVCRDETPGQTPGALAKVVCVQDMLHHKDTGAASVILPEITAPPPGPRPQAPTSTTEIQTQPQIPATATLRSPTNLGVDAVGNIFVSDRLLGSITEFRRDGLTSTFISGFDGLGAIAVEGGYLYAMRNGDVVRVPLGISGQIVDSEGQPAALATVIARGAGGSVTPTFTTDANGQFSTSLESLDAQVSGDRVNIFLTVTTRGTATVPSQTHEFVVPLDVNPQGDRTQTITRLTLPAPSL